MGNYAFRWNERLEIELPVLISDWEHYSAQERMNILEKWEIIRGSIPDRVFAFERLINLKQEQLNTEEDFEMSCRLNSDIADLASRINDLHIWYRINQEIDSRRHS
jgi:hypothetical protein